MNLNSPTEFRQDWDALDDPKDIRETMERDQEAEDKKELSDYPFRVEGGQEVRHSVEFKDTTIRKQYEKR